MTAPQRQAVASALAAHPLAKLTTVTLVDDDYTGLLGVLLRSPYRLRALVLRRVILGEEDVRALLSEGGRLRALDIEAFPLSRFVTKEGFESFVRQSGLVVIRLRGSARHRTLMSRCWFRARRLYYSRVSVHIVFVWYGQQA